MPTQASHPSSTEAHSTDEVEQTYRKVVLRLMPFLILYYIVSYLDALVMPTSRRSRPDQPATAGAGDV